MNSSKLARAKEQSLDHYYQIILRPTDPNIMLALVPGAHTRRIIYLSEFEILIASEGAAALLEHVVIQSVVLQTSFKVTY